MRAANIIALGLVLIGALNWLLVSLFNFDLVATLFAQGFGTVSEVSRIVYGIVGVAAFWVATEILPKELATRRETEHTHQCAPCPTPKKLL